MHFMSRTSSVPIFFFVVIVALSAAPARAEDNWMHGAPEFSMGVSYANVDLKDSPVIDSESAIRFEPTLSMAPLRESLPQLRLGFDVGFTLVLDNSNRTIISNNGNLIFFGSSDVPLWLVEPELRISWRQYFGETFFVEGGVGGGCAFGFLDLKTPDGSSTADSFHESDNTFFGRAFLRAGSLVPGGIAGIEGSYLVGDSLDFGGSNASGDLTEWSVGIFGALVF